MISLSDLAQITFAQLAQQSFFPNGIMSSLRSISLEFANADTAFSCSSIGFDQLNLSISMLYLLAQPVPWAKLNKDAGFHSRFLGNPSILAKRCFARLKAAA